MKYTTQGFNQEELFKLQLDTTDTTILRWFVDFQSSGKMAQVSSEYGVFLWVKYQSVIDDLPTLFIKNREIIARRFQNFVNCGLMEKLVEKDGGTYTCFRLVPKVYSRLIENIPELTDPSTKKSTPPPDLIVDPPVYSKVDPKDSSINLNSSIKNTKMYGPDTEPYRLAVLLRKEHLEIDPQYLPPGAPTEKILQGWSKEIDKLLRLKKRDAQEVARVIHWIKHDYHPDGDPVGSSWKGWATVIMSGDNLYKKYDQILPKTKNNGSISSRESSKVQAGTPGFELLKKAANRGASGERDR